MIVNRNREGFFGSILSDDVLVQNGFDLSRLRNRVDIVVPILFVDLFGDDVIAKANALVTNIDRWTGDELFDFFLGFAAKRAGQITRGIGFLMRHGCVA